MRCWNTCYCSSEVYCVPKQDRLYWQSIPGLYARHYCHFTARNMATNNYNFSQMNYLFFSQCKRQAIVLYMLMCIQQKWCIRIIPLTSPHVCVRTCVRHVSLGARCLFGYSCRCAGTTTRTYLVSFAYKAGIRFFSGNARRAVTTTTCTSLNNSNKELSVYTRRCRHRMSDQC